MKYPKTLHIPGSPGTQSDDRIMPMHVWLNGLAAHQVIATEKMDGENTTMTREHIHARSEDSIDHPSRHYVKALHGAVRHMIPEGWRVVGENLFARHSVVYDDLMDWFQVFAIFNASNVLLPWRDTEVWCEQVGLQTVPCLGIWETGADAVTGLAGFDPAIQEGFVLRSPGPILGANFERCVAKWVRKGHVQTSEHWMYQQIVPNGRL